MRFGSLLEKCLVAVPALLLAGCLSGQTGSPDCVGPTSCLCDHLYSGGVLLRVHGESQEPGKLVAVVDALLSPSDQTLDLQIGDRIGGSVLAELPCAAEQEMGQLAGQELFVLYSPAGSGQHLDCPEFMSCADANCKGLAESELPMCWDMCQADSMEACAARREAALLDGAFGWVVPWGEELAFGGDIELSSADVAVVADVNSCLERFPTDPAPPCNDVRTVGCSVAQPAERPGWAWTGVFLAGLGLAWARRRWLYREASSRAVR